jgi:2-oxoglutarate dehydrogenase E1 component
LVDFNSENLYIPLNNISENQAKISVYDSPLSELGVMGFDYGFSVIADKSLTLWEAQFGDFANMAQPIIDQFVCCGEVKWNQKSNLVLLLPHGHEGQGPEHSSARIERFLQACAENNMQIVNTTTPAQQFHVLRRQLKRDFRKPLICFTPKKLLRYPSCVSKLKDFTTKNFVEVLDDDQTNVKKINRIAFCSGKVYYDLIERREKENADDIAFIRLEQLYPFPKKQVEAILEKYSHAKEFLFVQEEPENMGAWRFVDKHLRSLNLKYVGRDEAASPATGFGKRHAAEIEEMMVTVFSKVLVK